jgi:hypothetical protein
MAHPACGCFKNATLRGIEALLRFKSETHIQGRLMPHVSKVKHPAQSGLRLPPSLLSRKHWSFSVKPHGAGSFRRCFF